VTSGSAVPAVAASRGLMLSDVSSRRRFGCKGPGAEEWLTRAGFRVPAGANTAALEAGVLVARLATSEFLVEATGGTAPAVEAARTALGAADRPASVYPVARQDLVVLIRGPATLSLLRQICSVDFAPLLVQHAGVTDAVVLTNMIGVGVVAWPRPEAAGPGVTVWTDPSYGHYFWSTLLEIGRELEGGVSVDNPENPGSRDGPAGR
jgi:sarcosine oxidase subunit gamma